MNGYLIDTNVISECVKPNPNVEVMSWFRHVDPNALFAGVVTIGEIRLGIENMPDGNAGLISESTYLRRR